MKGCTNCIYKFYCYGDRQILNINVSCSGYISNVKKSNKKTKEK